MTVFEHLHMPSLGGATEWLNSEVSMFRRLLQEGLYRVRGNMFVPLRKVGLASHIRHGNFGEVWTGALQTFGKISIVFEKGGWECRIPAPDDFNGSVTLTLKEKSGRVWEVRPFYALSHDVPARARNT